MPPERHIARICDMEIMQYTSATANVIQEHRDDRKYRGRITLQKNKRKSFKENRRLNPLKSHRVCRMYRI